MFEPKIAILMATYNGEAYIEQQLQSIQQQTHKNFSVYASDDGSKDHTKNILKNYHVQMYNGPAKGFAQNFMSLVHCVPDTAEYFAFCDQDDVWDAQKLAVAINKLAPISDDTPALYCGRTTLADAALNVLGYSPCFKKIPQFKNALTQSVAGGNTMVFNRAALDLLRKTPKQMDIVSHDWWAYLLISGAGGKIVYDEQSYVLYRQHGKNLVGTNMTLSARFYRIRQVSMGRLQKWTALNLAGLVQVKEYLTEENQKILYDYIAARKMWCLPRVLKILQLKIHRQGSIEQIGFMVSALFNKI